MLKLKTGDTIKIMSGKDRGREGKIEKIFPGEKKVLVPGLNIYKKHVKSQSGQKGGIFDIPRSLLFSKVAVVCPFCKKPARIGFRLVDGKKRRVCRKCKREIDKR